jgi:arylsulfatase A-like enzyme
MSKITIKGYIVHQVYRDTPHDKGTFAFQTYPAFAGSSIYIQTPVCEHELTVNVPDDFDPRPGQIAALEKQKQEMRAKFAAAVKEIDDRINSLLALEMS